jgi:hypothetical protein
MLFMVGFMKHFFGYFLKIHDYYCQYGCGDDNKNRRTKKNELMLTGESILEGVAFIILGSILSVFLKSKVCVYFILGAGIHIISEKIGLHTYFCEKRCVLS